MTSVALLRRNASPSVTAEETGALLAPYEAGLRFLCRDLLNHPEDAEDALQETFLRAIRGLKQFRGESQLKTWLTRIAIRVCLEQRRRPVSPSPIPVPVTSIETQTIQRMLLNSALSELPPRRRAVFLLKEVEGWSLAEIAVATSITIPHAKIELYRARKTLSSWAARQEILEKRV
jgi:RNA polymerase sigma-70 factor, ECF subfamily